MKSLRALIGKHNIKDVDINLEKYLVWPSIFYSNKAKAIKEPDFDAPLCYLWNMTFNEVKKLLSKVDVQNVITNGDIKIWVLDRKIFKTDTQILDILNKYRGHREFGGVQCLSYKEVKDIFNI